MSRLRWTLLALLVAPTVLFAVGVTVERSDSDTHAEAASAHSEAAGGEPEGAHDETAETGEVVPAESHSETAASEAHSEGERVLGVDLESTPLVVLAVVAGLGLAALTATRLGRTHGFLLAVAVIALVWAAFDVREVVHQLDESRTGVALLATIVALLHFAAALVSGRLARHTQVSAA
jgi:hypothetical protein